MPFKTITIKKTAYEKLKRAKKKGESFTDVIVRITPEPTSLMDMYGILKDSKTSAEEMLKTAKAMRKELNETLEERQKNVLSRL